MEDDGWEIAIAPSGPQDDQSAGSIVAKAHWRAPGSRLCCGECRVKFDVVTKRDWCRRCGDVFCRRCVRHARRLNCNAHPDPVTGVFYPVCLACFREGSPQTLGVCRERSAGFLAARRHARDVQDLECGLTEAARRLAAAFAGASPLARALSSLVVSEWAKTNWLSDAAAQACTACPACAAKFGLVTRRHHCRLCGCVFCSQCLFHSILVYLEGSVPKVCPAEPGLAPPGHAVVQACAVCLNALKDTLAARQAKHQRHSKGTTLWTVGGRALVEASAACGALEPRIAAALATYQEMIAAMGAVSSGGVLSGRGAVPKMAKHQIDLSDLFMQYAKVLQAIKMAHAREPGAAHRELAKRVLGTKTTFYRLNFWAFRSLKLELQELLPEEAMAVIQLEMDMQAMNYAYCVLLQITIESFAWRELEPLSRLLSDVTNTAQEACQALVEAKNDVEWTTFDTEAKAVVAELGRTNPLLTAVFGRVDWPVWLFLAGTHTLARLTLLLHWQARVKAILSDLLAAVRHQLTTRATIKVPSIAGACAAVNIAPQRQSDTRAQVARTTLDRLDHVVSGPVWLALTATATAAAAEAADPPRGAINTAVVACPADCGDEWVQL